MNCAKAKKMLVDYTESLLPDRKRLAVEQHLSGCELCRAELAHIERLKESIRSLETSEREPEFWERFNRKLSRALEETGKQAPAPVPVWTSRKLTFATAAVIGLVVILGLVVFPRLSHYEKETPRIASQGAVLTPATSEQTSPESSATYASNGIMLALGDLSSEELESVNEEVFDLMEEDLQPISDDLFLGDSYNGSLYDVIEDLSLDESETVYEILEST